MPNLMPNTAILKSPSNWFLVAFSVVILAFASHQIFKGKVNG